MERLGGRLTRKGCEHVLGPAFVGDESLIMLSEGAFAQGRQPISDEDARPKRNAVLHGCSPPSFCIDLELCFVVTKAMKSFSLFSFFFPMSRKSQLGRTAGVQSSSDHG